MRRLVVLGFLGLAACASPQEQCIQNAGANLRVVDKLIAETRGNLARGFAIETRQVLITEAQVIGQDADGDDIVVDSVVAEDERVPVAIDLVAEQNKLNSLVARRAELVSAQNAAIKQCVALYPEG